MQPSAPAPGWRLPVEWLGILPFVAFALLFLILPTMKIVIGAFQSPDGGFTLQNLRPEHRFDPQRLLDLDQAVAAHRAVGLRLSGFAMASAVVFGGLPKGIRSPLLTFSGVASNFAGVPLAFAFIATLGPAGLVTLWLKTEFGINLRAYGFNLLSFWGLVVTYLFFQIPLMILIIIPGAGRAEARMARGGRGAGRHRRAILAHGGAADPVPLAAGHLRAACSPMPSAPSPPPSR
jgi:putative spermidine/putrescine transport system permease protein